MIIGIDMYPRLIFQTGVRVVIDNILQKLKERYPEHTIIELRPDHDPLKTTRKAYGKKIYNHLQRIIWTQIGLPLKAKRAGCDILFCTCHFSPYIQPMPTITLFYDMAIWLYPHWYNYAWNTLNKIFAEWPAKWNSHITTISEDARKDIIHIFKLPQERVTSVHLGVDLPTEYVEHDIDVLNLYGIEKNASYILYMGPAIPHKNLPKLAEAFALVLEKLNRKDILLVIGGPSSNTHGPDNLSQVREVISKYDLADNVRFPGYVPRSHCSILFKNASVYVFPSLFEGFGLPIIESMHSGTPVVSANRASLPEIGGEAVVYFDPLDTNNMSDAICLVLTQPRLREEMIKRGYERVKQFSWDKTADGYMHVFEQVYKQCRNHRQ